MKAPLQQALDALNDECGTLDWHIAHARQILSEAIAEPSDTDILKLAHRMAWRYKHETLSSGIEYTFNNMTLLDFVRALKGLK